MIVGNKVLSYGPGQYLVVPVDLPVIGRISHASSSKPYLAISISLKPSLIANLLLEADVGAPPMVEAEVLTVSDAPGQLLDPLIRLLQLLDQPKDIPVLAPMIEREIMWRLLHCEQSYTVRQIGLVDSRLSQVARAIGWVREHFAEPIHISSLAQLAGMSLSSFHRHFRAVTAMSPLQFQKRVRLQEARNRLLGTSDDAAAVGFAVGYQSPSQFSREYRRLFGSPPLRDVERVRFSAPSEATRDREPNAIA